MPNTGKVSGARLTLLMITLYHLLVNSTVLANQDDDDLLLMLAPILATLNRTLPPAAGELSVEQAGDRLFVSSSKPPTWKVQFAIGAGAPGGGTAVGLHIPAQSSSMVEERPNRACCSGLGLDNLEWRWREFGGTQGTRSSIGYASSVTTFSILENTPQQLVFMLEGSWPGVSYFKRTTTVTVDGYNTVVEADYSGITNKDSMWWISALFHADKLDGDNVTIQDADSGPHPLPYTNGGTKVPQDIWLPYRINYPLQGTSNVAKLTVKHLAEDKGYAYLYEYFNSGPPVGDYHLVFPRWRGRFENTRYLFEWEWRFTPEDEAG